MKLANKATILAPARSELLGMYVSGKSMSEIAIILGCSINKVRYWMNKHNIRRRTRSDAAYIKLNPNGDPFKTKSILTKSEMFLYGLGLGIYWGEGNKTETGSLRVSNTDPALIRAFINFLLKIYRLDKNRLSYSIVAFNDVNPETVRLHWANELKISPQKFGKITSVASQGSGKYRKKSAFGVCTVQGNNVKLKRIVMAEIKKLGKGKAQLVQW